MKRKIVTGVLCAVFMGIFLTGCSDTSEGKKQTDEKKEKIIIGVSSVSVDLGESGKKALEKKGYEVEVKVFDDYVLPNKALEEGSIDANLYQHEPYLDNYNKSNGTEIQKLEGYTILSTESDGEGFTVRLMRTEMARVQTESAKRSMEENEFEEYEFMAEGTACPICRAIDGKHYKVKNMLPGTNAAPMHPNCRCAVTPYLDRKAFENWIEEKSIEKPDSSGIMNSSSTKEDIEVHSVGKIDRDIYKCITKNIVTDEVIITDERIEHIKERHPNDYERFYSYIPEIISNPDYIIEANKPNTAVVLKEIEERGEKFKLVLRIKVQGDPEEYKNSIMTFWHIGETTWRKTLKNKTILYKKE